MRIVLSTILILIFSYPAMCSELDRLTTICASDSKFCMTSLKQFRVDYQKAYKGSYQSQRNVGFCFLDGCDGAVITNKIQACAWRKVLLASGSPYVNDLDLDNHKIACGHLSGLELGSARERATMLMKEIYKRELPLSLME